MEDKLEEVIESNEYLQNKLEQFKKDTREIFQTSNDTKELILSLRQDNLDLKQALENVNEEFEDLKLSH